MSALLNDLQERGGLNLTGCIQDGTIVIDQETEPLKITADPRLYGTWQLNTFFIFLSPVLANQPDRLR